MLPTRRAGSRKLLRYVHERLEMSIANSNNSAKEYDNWLVKSHLFIRNYRGQSVSALPQRIEL